MSGNVIYNLKMDRSVRGKYMGAMTVQQSSLFNFCNKLRESGKDEKADFYEVILGKIMVLPENANIGVAIEQVRRSAELACMTNFSQEEERLFDLLHEGKN